MSHRKKNITSSFYNLYDVFIWKNNSFLFGLTFQKYDKILFVFLASRQWRRCPAQGLPARNLPREEEEREARWARRWAKLHFSQDKRGAIPSLIWLQLELQLRLPIDECKIYFILFLKIQVTSSLCFLT